MANSAEKKRIKRNKKVLKTHFIAYLVSAFLFTFIFKKTFQFVKVYMSIGFLLFLLILLADYRKIDLTNSKGVVGFLFDFVYINYMAWFLRIFSSKSYLCYLLIIVGVYYDYFKNQWKFWDQRQNRSNFQLHIVFIAKILRNF